MYLILVELLLLEDLLVMLASLVERLYVILMVDGVDMVEVLSLVRIHPRLIDQLLMLLGGLLGILLPMDSVKELWYKLPMLSVLLNHWVFMLIAMVLSLMVIYVWYLGFTDHDLQLILFRNFDLRPGMIIKELDLKRPIYKKTASGGHFGRTDPDFTWEKFVDLSHEKKKKEETK